MNHIETEILFIILAGLLLLSAFFSSSETGMMSLNKYKLRHQVKQKHKTAIRVEKLLQKPDKLISVILIGNNLVNIFATSIATIIGIRLLGDSGIFITSLVLTLVVLIFAEVTPKTIAALKPELIAFPASYALNILQYLLTPFVWLINLASNLILRLIGIKHATSELEKLSKEEFKTLVSESNQTLGSKHQGMLMNILELETATVNDIMIPCNEIQGIDLEDDIEEIIQTIRHSQHTRIPIYTDGEIDKTCGIIHVRKASDFLLDPEPNKAKLMQYSMEAYYIPENTPLTLQLINFQKSQRRLAMVVNEYGVIIGLVTLEDILEEIVGEFTTDYVAISGEFNRQSDGSWVVDGQVTLREANRALKINLPIDGPKTLNGLIIETLEQIPKYNVCIKIGNVVLEAMHITDNTIKAVKITKLAKKKVPKTAD